MIRKKKASRGAGLFWIYCLAFQLFDELAIFVIDIDYERHVAGQAVGAAGMAGIVGPEAHLRHVQQSFGHIPPLMKVLAAFSMDMLMAGGVVDGGHDQVGFLDDAAFVGLVVVDQGPAGSFDDADAFIGCVGRDGRMLGSEMSLFSRSSTMVSAACRASIKTGPVEGQGVVGRLAAERLRTSVRSAPGPEVSPCRRRH